MIIPIMTITEKEAKELWIESELEQFFCPVCKNSLPGTVTVEIHGKYIDEAKNVIYEADDLLVHGRCAQFLYAKPALASVPDWLGEKLNECFKEGKGRFQVTEAKLYLLLGDEPYDCLVLDIAEVYEDILRYSFE